MKNFNFDKEVDDIRKRLPFRQSQPVRVKSELKRTFEEIVTADAHCEFAGIRISQIDLSTSFRNNETRLSTEQKAELANIDSNLSKARELLGIAAYDLGRILNNE